MYHCNAEIGTATTGICDVVESSDDQSCECEHAADAVAGLPVEVSSDRVASNFLCESECGVSGILNADESSDEQHPGAVCADESSDAIPPDAGGIDTSVPEESQQTDTRSTRHRARTTRRGEARRGSVLPILLLSAAIAGTLPAGDKVARGLCLGSSDPHVLGGEQAAQPPRRGAAFSVLAHAEATVDDLMARPFASMNEPTATEPLDADAEVLDAPPVVTRRDQVIPPATQKIVSAWRRRARRCMTLAEKGLFNQARRMRPPDVWLPAESHQTPETRQWAWDFTPLARGEPACPMGQSKREAADQTTVATVEALIAAKARGDFADEAIIDEMIAGMSDDVAFDPSRHGTLLCAPHLSALREWSIACERTSANVTRGWAYEDALPCWPMRACPYGVVDESERAGEAKYRLTNDLSWPPPGMLPAGGGEFVLSHNDEMDRSRWPPARMIHVRDVAEAAAIMQLSGAPVKLWSVDCEAFYRKMHRRRAEIWRNVMLVPNGFQVDTRCCFGSAADAAKCARVSNLLAHEGKKAMAAVDRMYPPRDQRILDWQRARREACGELENAQLCDALGQVGLYIDDAPACSFDDLLFDVDGNALWQNGVHVSRAQAHFDAFCQMLERFGHTSKRSKEQRPCLRLEVLGVEIDLESRRMWLSLRTAKRYRERVLAATKEKQMPRLEYLRLMGRLQFAAAVFPRGRQWLHAAWRVARARFRLAGDKVQITARVRREFGCWAAALRSPEEEGVPLAARREVEQMGNPGVGAIYADASGSIGWAAWTVAGDTLYWCGGEWSDDVRQELHINEMELFASTVGLMTLAPMAGLSQVHNFTDNTVAMSAMRSATAKSARMQELLAARVEWMLSHGINEAALRVSTRANLWADLGSRGEAAEMQRQAEQLGLSVVQIAPCPQLRTADYLVGMHGDVC